MTNYSLSYTKSSHYLKFYQLQILCAFLFIINPIFSIFILALFIIHQKATNEELLYSLYVLISLYLGLINSTRTPLVDLRNYEISFERASYLNIFDFLYYYPKDPIFYIVTFLCNKIFFANFKLYVIFITFCQYYLMFLAIHKYWKNNDKSLLLFAVLIFSIFSRFFFASAYLIRQMLAGSVFIYFFVTKIVEKKTYWWLIPIGFLIHSSSIILYVLSFIPRLEHKLTIRNGVYLLFLGISVVFLGRYMLIFLDSLTKGINYLNYPIQRIASLGSTDLTSWYDGSSANSSRYFYYVQLLPVIAFANVYLKGRLDTYAFLNLSLILIFACELLFFSNYLYIQLRFMYYLAFVIPFVYPYLFFKNRLYSDIAVKTLGMTFIIVWFIHRLIMGFNIEGIGFAPIGEIIAYPVPMYFMN